MHNRVKILFIGVFIFTIYFTGVQVCLSATEFENTTDETINTSEPELYVFNDSSAIMYNDVCLVPIQKLCEYAGAEMEWKQANKMIIVTFKGSEIKMQENNKYVTLAPKGANYSNHQSMDTPVITYNGKHYVSAKFISSCMMAKADWDEQYLQIDTFGNEYLVGNPTKSALFPILVNPDLKQLPKLPQVKILNESSIPKDDLKTLKSKLMDVFKKLYFNSDISVSLVNGKDGKYLNVYIPLIKSYCQNINYQNSPYNEEYYYRIRAKEITSIMKDTGNVIYRSYKNEMDSGLWEEYSSGIKVTMINSRKETLSITMPFKVLKIEGYKFYLPNTDSSGTYYQTYLNNKLLGGRDVEGWTEKYDNKLMQFFNAPVTKPLSPYFNVIDTSIPF